MTSESAQSATPGEWIEARGLPGRSARRGQIVEILGHGRREHYRVRWDERRESIVYPADGVNVVGRRASDQLSLRSKLLNSIHQVRWCSWRPSLACA